MRGGVLCQSLRAVLIGLLALPAPLLATETKAYDPELVQQLRDRVNAGEWEEVEAEGRALLVEVELEEGRDSLAAADVLGAIVHALGFGPQPGSPESIALAERALAINESHHGPVHLGVARALNDLASLRFYAGDYATARPLFERSLAIREELLGAESDIVARALFNLGNLNLYFLGDYAAALDYFERAAGIFEKAEGSRSERYAITVNKIGQVVMQQGNPAESLAYFDDAQAIFESIGGPEHPDIPDILNSKAIAHELMGDYSGALSYYEQALQRYQTTVPEGHRYIGQVHANLAILTYTIGDIRSALEHVQRAVTIYEEGLGAEHPETLRIVNTYGTVLDALGETEQAIDVLERNLGLREKVLGSDNFEVAESQGALGVNYLDAGKAEMALPLLERSLATREAALGPDHPVVAISLVDLGRALSALGETQRARELLERALQIREARLGPDHPDTAKCLIVLAELDWKEAKRSDALQNARRAARVLQESARETLAVLPERKALLLIANQARAEELLISGLLSSSEAEAGRWLEAAWEWSLAWRGLVLEELAKRHRAVLARESDEARQAWERLAEARRALAVLWVGGSGEADPDRHGAELDEARRAKESAEAKLARLSASFRREQRERQITLQELPALLPGRSVLIEWVRVRAGAEGAAAQREWRDVALILGADGRRSFVDLGPSKTIDAAVSAWREALDASARELIAGSAAAASEDARGADALAEAGRAGAVLRGLIWDPLPAAARGADRIFLVPDGALHQVDLAALPGEKGGYLIEHGPAIHLLGSGRDLARIAGRSGPGGAPGRGLLAVGDPDFNADRIARDVDGDPGAIVVAYRGETPECLRMDGASWRALPESGREARQVSELFGDAEPIELLTGAAASEDRVKRAAPGHRVLHLATHGFFLAGECDAGPGSDSMPAVSPLLLSGLVLAGANRSAEAAAGAGAEDGILTAEELAALDLRGVELAVLSACDTGLGEVAIGEGVFGLRRALEIAGVRSVVMSLWPIPDRQARRWMSRFYTEQRDGRSIPDAARNAALANLRDLRERDLPDHPYHWAGIVAAGDWRGSR